MINSNKQQYIINESSKFVLTKKVKIERYLVKTQYQIRQKRKDLLIVLKFIHEFKENYLSYPTPKIIREELLAIPIIGIKRLIQRLANLDLIDLDIHDGLISDEQHLILTEKGRLSISEGNVFLPSEGILEFSVIDDPLFSLYFYGIRESPQYNNKELKEDLNKHSKPVDLTQTTKLEQYIGAKINGEIEPYLKGEIIIEAIDKNGIRLPPIEAIISIEVTPNNKTNAYIQGTNRVRFSFSLPQELSYSNLFDNFQKNYQSDKWENGYFLVKSKELKNQEKKSFLKKSLIIQDLKINEKYVLNQVKFQNVPIQPINQEEAYLWLKELVIDDIDYFVTEKEFNEIVERNKKNFVFHKDQLSLTLETVLNTIKDKIEKGITNYLSKFWYLQAPIDLRRWN